MNNNITVSLEMAQALKRHNWKKETVFYWDMLARQHHLFLTDSFSTNVAGVNPASRKDASFAPTSQELLDVLPPFLEKDGTYRQLFIIMEEDQQLKKQYVASYCARDKDVWVKSSETLADALAKLYIYLVENNLLPTE